MARHSFLAILLAVMIEELGIPMPIPTDVQIVLAGTIAGRSLPQLGLFFVMLSVASAVGASGLYAIVRRGGRPLVERFGRYVHLGPKQLARSEALLARGGWIGIAIGRAIPGLRYPTVIACGLFKVPYPRFVFAHLAGSSVYLAVFLALGALFGPAILERIHLPALGIRLLWLLPLAVGLPLLMVWWGSRAHPRRPVNPSRRRAAGAALLGGFVGATTLAATWSATATTSELLGTSYPPTITRVLLRWLVSLGLDVKGVSPLLYAALLSLFVGLAVAYYEFVLTYLTPHVVSLPRQALGLTVLALGLLGAIFAPPLLVVHVESSSLWPAGGPIALGAVSYALTVVYGRALAIAVAPSLRRGGS